MIILRIKATNFACFNAFDINFVYAKKNTSSTLENEFLSYNTKFNYKKVNIIYGNNASGKSSLGKLILSIFNFIFNGNTQNLIALINNENEESYFLIDFISKDALLTRVECKISENKDFSIKTESVSCRTGTYKANSEKLDKLIGKKEFSNNYLELLKNLNSENVSWNFNFPSTDSNEIKCTFTNPSLRNEYCTLLTVLLKTFDKNILSVGQSIEADNAYVITLTNKKKIIIQDGMNIENIGILSSGTKYAINIASLLISIKYNLNGFYYVDEQFSYISSELENILLSLMICYLPTNSQLFFTTHNLDLLDKLLPKHSFLILRQGINGNSQPIYIENYINKNNQSLRNLYENDYFNNFANTTEIEKLIWNNVFIILSKDNVKKH